MAFMVSPGIAVTETDLTASTQQVSVSDAAFAGPFQWGPVLEVRNVASEDDLVRIFGKPDDNTARHWFSAQAFLAYSNLLKAVRVVNSNALNASEDAKTLDGTVFVQAGNTTIISNNAFSTATLVAGQTVIVGNSSVSGVYTINTITNSTAFTVTTAPTGANVNSASVQAYGTLVKNTTHFETVQSGLASFGAFVAKYPGSLGNTVKVSVCPSANAYSKAGAGTLSLTSGSATVTGVASNFTAEVIPGSWLVVDGRSYQVDSVTNTTQCILKTAATATVTTLAYTVKWEYHNLFDGAPGTSPFAASRGGVNDELHVVVVDEYGWFTGTPGTVVERYGFVTKALDGKSANGDNNYYADVINRRSAFVWSTAHPGTTTATWGQDATTTFLNDALPWTVALVGGNAGSANISDAALQEGYDLFRHKDEVDVSLVISGPATATLASYIIGICESRMDCIAFVSPEYSDVVFNAGNEVADIAAFRNNLPSSSYAFLDSGWKYTYDKYNDKYRWVPLNGDIAGLAARTDTNADPWFSPAGFTRGNIKNVVKLAWNPKQADRDDLYKISVNPVVSFPAQGVILYGDKTLLNRPSAFDRINVRRLFIILQKTVARLAQAQLFEFNDEYTRSAFRNVIEPYLRDVKARRGIVDFRVVCDESNNTSTVIEENRFVGDIYVKPAQSINFITLNFVAVRSGVSFQEIAGA